MIEIMISLLTKIHFFNIRGVTNHAQGNLKNQKRFVLIEDVMCSNLRTAVCINSTVLIHIYINVWK